MELNELYEWLDSLDIPVSPWQRAAIATILAPELSHDCPPPIDVTDKERRGLTVCSIIYDEIEVEPYTGTDPEDQE